MFKARREIIAELKAKQEFDEQSHARKQVFKQTLSQWQQTLVTKKESCKTIILPYVLNFIITTKTTITTLLQRAKTLKNTILGHITTVTPKVTMLSMSLVSTVGCYVVLISKGVKKTVSVFSSQLWQLRMGILVLILLIGIGSNITVQSRRFSYHPLSDIVQTVNYWPTVPTSLLTAAQETFRLGHQDIANHYFALASQQIAKLETVWLDTIFSSTLNQTKAVIETPQRKQHQLEQLNQELTVKPYSWQLLLAKEKIQAELFQDEEKKATEQLIQWLYPTYQIPQFEDNQTANNH